MDGYFLFPYDEQLAAGKRRRYLVLFVSTAAPQGDAIIQVVREFCEREGAPDVIIFLAPSCDFAAVEAAIEKSTFREDLASATRYRETPSVVTWFFNYRGLVEDETFASRLRRVGMTRIFVDRHALLDASAINHYVKPSGEHCNKFLRTANALVDSAEIDFIAFCCLRFVPFPVDRIYCDTGSISSVAYAIVALQIRFGAPQGRTAISSFASYRGFQKFPFRLGESTVVLVSASTSGNLAKELTQVHGLEPDQIATLFYLGTPSSTSKIVCDLNRHRIQNSNGLEAVSSYPEKGCDLCNAGSTPVLIRGDHFLTEGGLHDEVTMAESDLPAGLGPFMQTMIGTEYVKVNYRTTAPTNRSQEIYLDLQSLFGDANRLKRSKFYDRFVRVASQATSKVTKRILHLRDKASAELARRIAEKLGISGKKVLSVADVSTAPERFALKDGATLVVAAAIISGHSLLEVSMLLRTLQKNRVANYFVAFARSPDLSTFNEVRRNVTHDGLPDDRGFFVMERVFLPQPVGATATVWDREAEWWKTAKESAEAGEDDQLLTFANERIFQIANSSGDDMRGLRNETFLPCCGNGQLRLRDTFAYFKFDYDRTKVSQADVYLTIAAVLHSMRGKSDRLQQKESVRRILSPACFERFNDGVIQAAILRAALPAELDYSLSEKLSRRMKGILDVLFTGVASEVGEASYEFALALAMRRLHIRKSDLDELKTNHTGENADPLLRSLLKRTP